MLQKVPEPHEAEPTEKQTAEPDVQMLLALGLSKEYKMHIFYHPKGIKEPLNTHGQRNSKYNQAYLLKSQMEITEMTRYRDFKNKGYLKWQRNQS